MSNTRVIHHNLSGNIARDLPQMVTLCTVPGWTTDSITVNFRKLFLLLVRCYRCCWQCLHKFWWATDDFVYCAAYEASCPFHCPVRRIIMIIISRCDCHGTLRNCIVPYCNSTVLTPYRLVRMIAHHLSSWSLPFQVENTEQYRETTECQIRFVDCNYQIAHHILLVHVLLCTHWNKTCLSYCHHVVDFAFKLPCIHSRCTPFTICSEMQQSLFWLLCQRPGPHHLRLLAPGILVEPPLECPIVVGLDLHTNMNSCLSWSNTHICYNATCDCYHFSASP